MILRKDEFLSYWRNIASNSADVTCSSRSFRSVVKPHSARTGRAVFSQLTAAVVRHKANGVYTLCDPSVV